MRAAQLHHIVGLKFVLQSRDRLGALVFIASP